MANSEEHRGVRVRFHGTLHRFSRGVQPTEFRKCGRSTGYIHTGRHIRLADPLQHIPSGRDN